ncbi:MAG: hypothetical protein Q9227_005000 [Pyrenula ochraceoflavens]
MLPGIFSGQGHASNAKYFDIRFIHSKPRLRRLRLISFNCRLQDDYIVFRGNEQEASSAHLKGSVVLCLTEPMTVKYIRLTLTGISRVSWYLNTATSSKRAFRERSFFEKTWLLQDPGKGKTEIMKVDNYEFPFDLILDGSLPESVEGLGETFVIYRFRAEIGRKYSKDIVTRKPLRIIRTLDPSNLELSYAMSVDNIWPNKIEYSISTPTKAVAFGTSVKVNFRLVSLLKGLRIGQITTQVLESHELMLDFENRYSQIHKNQKVIAEDEYMVDDGSEPQILNEEAEGYEFARHIELPKSLRKCLQDTEARGIKIRHKLKFNVQLHNPDGHVSELRASLPVSFFISPTIAINENNDLVDQAPVAGRVAAEDQLNAAAPPLYGEHHFDQLYSDVDHSGYWTPGAALSSPGTPLGAHSRDVSSENLVSLAAVGNGSNVSAAALQHRLNNLRFTSPRQSPNEMDQEYFQNSTDTDAASSHNGSESTSGDMSRRTSADANMYSGQQTGLSTPLPYSNEFEDISKIPSYSTAVKSPLRHPQSTGLPSYDDATSRNNSVGSDAGPTLPQPPSQAHLRRTGLGARSGPNLVSLVHETPTQAQRRPGSRSGPNLVSLIQAESDMRRSFSTGSVIRESSTERTWVRETSSERTTRRHSPDGGPRTMQDEASRLRLLRPRNGP